ncbi:diguanylate phosphodiesterase [Pseudomonas sp. SWI36]|nr:diguanylate phosphodiesterase [Pseudomonas sp. SWI36]
MNPLLRRPVHVCRSGFTREYGGGGNGERRVEIG